MHTTFLFVRSCIVAAIASTALLACSDRRVFEPEQPADPTEVAPPPEAPQPLGRHEVQLSDISWMHSALTGDSAYVVVRVRDPQGNPMPAGVAITLSVSAPDGSSILLRELSDEGAGKGEYGGAAHFAWAVSVPGIYTARAAASGRTSDTVTIAIEALDGAGFTFYDLAALTYDDYADSNMKYGWIALAPDHRFFSAYATAGDGPTRVNSTTWGGTGTYDISPAAEITLTYRYPARLPVNAGSVTTRNPTFTQTGTISVEHLIIEFDDPTGLGFNVGRLTYVRRSQIQRASPAHHSSWTQQRRRPGWPTAR